jgi:hypothetical protein
MTNLFFALLSSLFTAAPSQGLQEAASLPCEITVKSANATLQDGGGIAMQGSSFPLRIDMMIHNTGPNEVTGITNTFRVDRGRAKTAPMPSETHVLNLPSGSTFTRTFELSYHDVDGGDIVYVDVRPDVKQKYPLPGKLQAPRRCTFKLEINKVAK